MRRKSLVITAEIPYKEKPSTLSLPLDHIEKNPWNPNRMDLSNYQKLKHGIQDLLLQENQDIPPIIVRPTKKKGFYEIIDGEHRWRVFRELFAETQDKRFWFIPCVVMDVSDAKAKIYTAAFNYLRGEAHVQTYADMIKQIIDEGINPEEIAKYLPGDEQFFLDLLTEHASNFDLDEFLESLYPEDTTMDLVESKDLSHRNNDPFVTLELNLPKAVAELFEVERLRISEYLQKKGVTKGLDIMTMEVFIMNSMNTPISQFQGEDVEVPKRRGPGKEVS